MAQLFRLAFGVQRGGDQLVARIPVGEARVDRILSSEHNTNRLRSLLPTRMIIFSGRSESEITDAQRHDSPCVVYKKVCYSFPFYYSFYFFLRSFCFVSYFLSFSLFSLFPFSPYYLFFLIVLSFLLSSLSYCPLFLIVLSFLLSSLSSPSLFFLLIRSFPLPSPLSSDSLVFLLIFS